MKVKVFFIACLLFPRLAFSSQIPSQIGWYEIPNSSITQVADPAFQNPPNVCITTPTACPLVSMIRAWNSADFDQTGDRLFVWGGGHGDYPGNEVYLFDLNTLSWTRISNASTPVGGCVATNPDGQIVSIHTYDTIAFDSFHNRLLQLDNGDHYPIPGCASFRNLWQFDPTLAGPPWWTLRIQNSSVWTMSEGMEAAWDPATHLMFFHDYASGGFFSYNYDTNTATRLATHSRANYQYTNFIDTLRHRYVEFGMNTMYSTDISVGSAYTQTTIASSIPAAAQGVWPGIAYDSLNDKYVAWNGGTTVYVFNPVTNLWTTQSNGCIDTSGNPIACTVPSSAVITGSGAATFGRWQYSPISGVFVLQNEAYQNVFTLRLNLFIGIPVAPTGLRVN